MSERSLVTGRRNEARLAHVRSFLAKLPAAEPALVLSASFETSAEIVRSLDRPLFGWTRSTVFRHALELARPALLAKGLTAVSALGLEALWARVAHQLGHDDRLDRLTPLKGAPGLSRALQQTIGEARLLELDDGVLEPALQAASRAYVQALAEVKLADRADVYRLALEALASAPRVPLAIVDARVGRGLERRFAQALVERASSVVVTVASGDDEWVTGLTRVEPSEPAPSRAVATLQARLFHPQAAPPSAEGDQVTFFSAPGEARECVEIARRVLEFAAKGVPFDRMAIFLRSPGAYRAGLEDAFRRAQVPAWFSSGLPHPDPAGRALLALLACAEEGLSARRFSEYLSLSQVPQLTPHGAPPPARDHFVRPDAADSLLPLEPASPPEKPAPEAVTDVEAPAVLGQLRAPRKWEKLIIEAAVIGGADRWARRLAGLRAQKQKERQSPTATEAQVERAQRELGDLAALEQFALPILELLGQFPRTARWSEWIVILRGLATRALKLPQRVLGVLHELDPMGVVGPISLAEVRRVLARRLAEVTENPEVRRHGRVFVAPTDAARGLSFDVVFVPGLAERVFPQKIREDPLLADVVRRQVSDQLEVSHDRIASERLALMLAVGAAEKHVLFSYPRIDPEHARPRVPSFYALEAAQAVQGELPGFEALQRQAEASGRVRLAWPAPEDPHRAIDDTEFDLAVLHRLLHARDPIKGHGRYLVTSSPHLARALRARYARWQQSSIGPWDGLVKPSAAARAALDAHHPGKRAFSPTALELYAACPYKFFLSAIVRLEPLEIPGELEELGPLEKGSMAHQVQFELLSSLRDEGVEVTAANLETEIFDRLHRTIVRVSNEVYDTFKPAIERVWQDGVQMLEADLREWLRETSKDTQWKPAHFELSFGLPGRELKGQDPKSTPDPVPLADGLQVRGSIDLVERATNGALRATDYKTGRQRAEAGNVIGGGRHIQPLLYALVLERIFAGTPVSGGRLYYTTQVGGFTSVETQLNQDSRDAFAQLSKLITGALEGGFFPAMPQTGEDECRWCKFRALCGPDEERRVIKTRKAVNPALKDLNELRKRP